MVTRRILEKIPQQQVEVMWEYPPLGDAIREVVIEEIEIYISMWQNMVTQYIYTCPIMDLCLDMGRRPGSRVSKR